MAIEIARYVHVRVRCDVEECQAWTELRGDDAEEVLDHMRIIGWTFCQGRAVCPMCSKAGKYVVGQ